MSVYNCRLQQLDLEWDEIPSELPPLRNLCYMLHVSYRRSYKCTIKANLCPPHQYIKEGDLLSRIRRFSLWVDVVLLPSPVDVLAYLRRSLKWVFLIRFIRCLSLSLLLIFYSSVFFSRTTVPISTKHGLNNLHWMEGIQVCSNDGQPFYKEGSLELLNICW